jgi:ABC-type polysaccharide/polyol phosphate export permease
MTTKGNSASSRLNEFDSANRGSLALEELSGVFKYKELIFQLVKRDLISRYKRSALGIAWTMLNPLGTMLILTLVFSKLFQSVQGYPIYILSGLIAWNFFAQTTCAALNQNIWGGSLLHRIYIPRTVFTLSSIGTGFVNLLLSLVPLLLIMLITNFTFHWTILFLPISILLLAFFSLGIGLIFSAFAIYFPDVVDMFQVGLTAWMYLTPIIYPAEIIPEPFRKYLLLINPMNYFVQIFRLPVYDGIIPSMNLLLQGSLIALVTLFIGWWIFTRRANELTYRT